MSAEKPQPVAWRLDEEAARFLRDFIGDGDDIAEIRLWVGTTVDLDGKEWHGLNVSLADYPEEGSVQLTPCAPLRRSLSDAEFLSIAYDVGAMPEQMTDAALLRFGRAVLSAASQQEDGRNG